jgi:molybdenum cofactor cytidylyltransferase
VSLSENSAIKHIAAIVLAAGGSTRMGKPKLLLPWQGEALIRWPVRTALEAGLSPVIVVTGAYPREVTTALNGLAVDIVHNADWEAGQSTSVRCGILALPQEAEAVVILLGDQPQLPVSLVQKLVFEYRSSIKSIPIFISSFKNKRRNPVLFDRSVFHDLLNLEGDAGGRMIFSLYPGKYVPVDDPTIFLDIDSPEDYQSLTGIKDP